MESQTRATLRIFWQHSKKHPWKIAAILFAVVWVNGVQVYLTILYRNLIDLLATGISPEVASAALRLVVIIAVWDAARAGVWRAANFIYVSFQATVMNELMNTCYQYLHRHSVNFFNSSFVGSLVTRVKRFERAYEQISDQLTFDLGSSLLNVILVIGILLWQYRLFGLILLAWSILFLIFIYIYTVYKLPYDIRRAAADTQTTAQLADSITNNTNIKLFTNYPLEDQRFRDVTHVQFLARLKSWNLGNWGDVVQVFSMIVIEFLILFVAVKHWQRGLLSVGDIALLQLYMNRIFDKLWNTGKNIRTVYEAIADGNEMTAMLQQPHEIADAPGAAKLSVWHGAIDFKNVSFAYHKDASILENFDLRIKPGERVALIGPSGGGKSTIIKLLFRFHELAAGEIAIDDQNIAMVTQDSLRGAIAFVPQEPVLFHRTLMENIRYARPKATDAEVVHAARLAHAHEFIEASSHGYETLVGERGIKLSGGERQRVAIARAILKDAPILVLDEATSSLDSESEAYIQDALKKLMQQRTTIVIAHRLSTIMQMDRIVVISGGKIIEEGKHEELLKAQQGTYQKLWEIQAGGFSNT